jgi:acetylornithine deacetylase
VVKGGNIYGRGTGDQKGGIVASIYAVLALVESGYQLGSDVYLECTVGEEQGESELGTIATIRRGYNAPFAVCTEPSGGLIVPISCGEFDFKLKIEGKEAHDASRNLVRYPQRYGIPCGKEIGVDAIWKMVKFLVGLRELEEDWVMRWRHPILAGGRMEDLSGVGGFIINPAIIRGGSFYTKIPGDCEIHCGVYYPSWVKGEDVIEEIRAFVNRIAQNDDWLREHPPKFEAPVTFLWPPTEISINHPGCKTLAKAHQLVNGVEAGYAGGLGAGNASWFTRNSIPAVFYGPGDLTMGLHGLDEHIPVDQLIRSAKTYAAFMADWCGATR